MRFSSTSERSAQLEGLILAAVWSKSLKRSGTLRRRLECSRDDAGLAAEWLPPSTSRYACEENTVRVVLKLAVPSLMSRAHGLRNMTMCPEGSNFSASAWARKPPSGRTTLACGVSQAEKWCTEPDSDRLGSMLWARMATSPRSSCCIRAGGERRGVLRSGRSVHPGQ